MSATSWHEAVAYYEGRIADGDRDALILQRLAERVAGTDLADLAEVVVWDDCLAVTQAGRPYAEGEPFVLVWAVDDWPWYEVRLEPGDGGRALASWMGEGEELTVGVIRDLVAWLRDPSGPPPAVPEPQPGFGP